MTTQDIDLGVLARGPQGPKGEQGNVGPAPMLKIGTVTKLGPDQTPTASLSGGNGSYTLNMGIPQGETNATATNALNIANIANSNANSALNKLNGIKIGGRNYLRDSDKSISGWAQDLGTMPNEVLNSLAGETITVSVDTEWSDYQHSDSKQNRLGFELAVSGSDGKSYWLGAWKSPETPSGKERVSTTFTLPANVTFTVNNNGYNGYVGINGTGRVSHAQVEIGNVSKDWQPALEDIQSEIDANKAAAANAQTSANNAQNTANSALSKANSNATALNNKANKSDLTWSNISGKPSIPSTFNGTISDTSTDFNNLISEGHYDIQISPNTQGKNGPNDSDWGLLDVKVAGRMVVQTYYGDNNANVYVRNRHGGSTWTAWREVTFWPRS